MQQPYVESVGLTGATLDQRLRSAPGITYRRMGQLVEFEWAYDSLAAWAENVL